MKISKLLNKKRLLSILFFVFISNSIANEPVDIWNIDKNTEKTDQESETILLDEIGRAHV